MSKQTLSVEQARHLQELHRYNVANGRDNVYSSPTLRCKDSGEPIEISWE